jgi:hypothetical protein
VCSLSREQWGGINLIRERGDPDFDAREMALLHRIVPHLGTGLKAAVLCKQASAEPEGEKRPWSTGPRRPGTGGATYRGRRAMAERPR